VGYEFEEQNQAGSADPPVHDFDGCANFQPVAKPARAVCVDWAVQERLYCIGREDDRHLPH